MSASILYEPVNPNPKSIGAWAPSHFMECMERAGMGLPCTLDESNIPTLRGMAAAFGVQKEAPNPYAELIEAIETNGKISVWSEH